MNLILLSYGLYLALSVGMTIWVARTLHRNGRVFLVRAFRGDERLADSVNHLLVVGFYLVNLGFILLWLRQAGAPASLAAMVEGLSLKLGVVLLVLGLMHFGNLVVFGRLHRRAAAADWPDPAPDPEAVGQLPNPGSRP
ncbi:MAG: hypothetical protein EA425_03805 [Puniceicoccaceae bacterium]|nr:MAG: hypothetical protein EA425_03805 [Puniceicoccaceae bacterium]